MKRSGRKMVGTFKEAKLQYKMLRMNKVMNITTAVDTANAIVYSFKEKRTLFENIMIFVKRVLSYLFLKIIFTAQKYHDDYLSNIDFDNVYVTKYFKKIDARRHKEDKTTLLPLKKVKIITDYVYNYEKFTSIIMYIIMKNLFRLKD